MTVIETPEISTPADAEAWHPAVPGNAGHPLEDAPMPYWLSQPCPPWCLHGIPHGDGERYEDRLHSGESYEIALTLEPSRTVEAEGEVIAEESAYLHVGLWQHYRERAPYITVLVSDVEEINLELAEAAAVARLLAAPPKEGWAQVILSMMDPVSTPPGPGRKVCVATFHRPPVLAVRHLLNAVTVFCPVRLGHDQAPRYLAFTPGEAADLAAAIVKLLDGAK